MDNLDLILPGVKAGNIASHACALTNHLALARTDPTRTYIECARQDVEIIRTYLADIEAALEAAGSDQGREAA